MINVLIIYLLFITFPKEPSSICSTFPGVEYDSIIDDNMLNITHEILIQVVFPKISLTGFLSCLKDLNLRLGICSFSTVREYVHINK